MNNCFLYVLFFTLTFLSFTTATLAWNFDSMILSVEKSLPLAEGQARIIIKMLSSEKHLARIQNDIDKIKEHKTLKAKDAYLYKVLKEVDGGKYAFEKSAMSANLIWEKGYSSYYAQPLYPCFLLSLSSGYYKIWKNPIFEDKDYLNNRERADALAKLCKKILQVQRSVLFLARKKLNIEGIRNYGNGGQFSSSGSPKALRKQSDSKNIYGFLFPGTIDYQSVRYKAVINGESYVARYPVEYLEYLKNQAEFLMALEFRTNLSTNWGQYIEVLSQTVKPKADGFDDLSSEERKQAPKKSKDKEFDFDDLELPK